MNEMIQRLIDKTGLSEEQATSAATTVIQFMKEKLPAPLASQLDSLSNGGGSVSDKLGGLGSSLQGMFGSKE